MSSVKIESLTKDNYDTWVIQAEAVLVRQKLWRYIETPLSPNATADEKDKDRIAKSELILIIAPTELKQIKNCGTAKDVWDKLKNTYASKGPARKASLLKQLILTKLEGQDVHSHLNKFLDVVDKLADMDVIIHNDLLTIMMLYSLSREYENFRIAIETRDILPTPEELKTKIFEEFEARHNQTMTYTNEPESSYEEEALYASCRICKRRGNIFKRKNHKICTNCWKKNNEKSKKQNTDSHKNNFATQCLLTRNKEPENSIWVLDSGCTSHMTHQRNLFKNIEKISRKLNFATEGYTAEIKGKGTVSFISKNGNSDALTHLKDTLYVPSLCTNLLSVSKMTNAGCSVLFTKNKATVNNPNAGITLIAHKQEDGLYYIKPSKHECNNLANDKDVETSTPRKKMDSSDIYDWHRKLGHMNAKDLKLALQNQNLLGLNFNPSETLGECETCILAKMHRVPAPREKTAQRTSELLEIVHTDVCGPIRTPTIKGNKYFVTFIDDYSRYSRVYILKNKNEVLDKFKEFKEIAETHTGKRIKFLQSDNGTEYINKDFDAYLRRCGIQRRLSAPYTPHQNGVAERKNRTLIEKARALLIDANAPLKCWGEAIVTANYLSNRSLNSAIENKTPFELWVGRKPCINHLYVFGCKTFVLIKDSNSHKFAPKAIPGMFIGYSETSKAFKILLPSKNKVIISKDIRVMKSMFYKEINKNYITDLLDDKPQMCSRKSQHKQVATEFDNVGDVTSYLDDINNIDSENVQQNVNDFYTEDVQPEEQENSESDYESLSGSNHFYENDEVVSDNADEASSRYSLRNRSAITAPKRYDDFIMAAAEEVENLHKLKEPQSFKEAMESPDKLKWQEAMQNEITSLKENHTWDLVNLPKRRKALPCRWVYKIKFNPDGSVDRYKARMVIKGYSQIPGVDYDRTFSPVARLTTVRSLLAVAAKENLKVTQFDVTTAFLNGELEDEIYMKQPEGYEDGTKRVCKLKRSLYGLKQAPRCWNICIAEFLLKSGFKQSEADPCLFVRNKNQLKVAVALYVDDGLIAHNTTAAGEEFLNELKSRFKITFKPASYFLGMEIIVRQDNSIFLCQKAYTKKILQKYGMSECKPAPSPVIKNNEIGKDEDSNTKSVFPYRQAVGALSYLSVGTRPDITYAVGVASRNLSAPTKEDVLLIKRIFRYLKGTLEQGLTFTNKSPPRMVCFSDADHGGDQTTGKSTSGIVCIFSGAAISWRSQKQPTVSLSSMEAEIIAASESAQEILWLNRLLDDLLKTEKPILNLDNESAVYLAHNPKYEYHKRTKHIKLKHFFIRECVSNGDFIVEQVASEDQLADMLTKPLYGPRLKVLSSRIGLKNLSQNS